MWPRALVQRDERFGPGNQTLIDRRCKPAGRTGKLPARGAQGLPGGVIPNVIRSRAGR
jgi:hypothetical protein